MKGAITRSPTASAPGDRPRRPRRIFVPRDRPGLDPGMLAHPAVPVRPADAAGQHPQHHAVRRADGVGDLPRSTDPDCRPSELRRASPTLPVRSRSTASAHVVKPCVTRLHPRRCRLRIFCENSSISPPAPRFFVEKSSAQAISTVYFSITVLASSFSHIARTSASAAARSVPGKIKLDHLALPHALHARQSPACRAHGAPPRPAGQGRRPSA